MPRLGVQDTARDLGAVIESQLASPQLRPAIRSLSEDASKALVQAFVSCRLDYCNSLLFGIADGLMCRLQSVQNAAARLVTGTRRCDHITPVHRQLHWLPVRQRVNFKVAALVHRSLSGDAPPYLADDCRLVADVRERRLRSADARAGVVTRTRSNFGDKCFAAAGPRLWNSLPLELRHPDIYHCSLRRSLKKLLFGCGATAQ